jgi:D-beta-D-heptose 7-phosphate kinase/D-beta-D-heptose 1-phosphate adenosyltransferase
MQKILIIGDSCNDIFIYGDCPRLCPEAPVPVFIPEYSDKMGGMSQNVANNIISLGIQCDIITQNSYLEKTRYVDKKTNQIIIRIDSTDDKLDRINLNTLPDLTQYNALVLSDYDKGFLSESDIEYLSKSHPLTFLDTKKILGDWCKNISFIKINKHEYNNTKNNIKDKNWMSDKLIVTLEDKGCMYKDTILPVEKVDVKDMSGAGDTFLAGLVVEFLKTQNIENSIKFANICATQVVQKKGVSVVKF